MQAGFGFLRSAEICSVTLPHKLRGAAAIG
jgi:hypothetical protein